MGATAMSRPASDSLPPSKSRNSIGEVRSSSSAVPRKVVLPAPAGAKIRTLAFLSSSGFLISSAIALTGGDLDLELGRVVDLGQVVLLDVDRADGRNRAVLGRLLVADGVLGLLLLLEEDDHAVLLCGSRSSGRTTRWTCGRSTPAALQALLS